MNMRITNPIARTLRVFGSCALLTVAGCFTLARPTPPLEEYALGETPKAASTATARDPGGVTVGLRRLDLAPYLATTAIVVRRGSRIVTSGFRRWAEEPGAGIMRAVAASIGSSPAILAVDIAPWPVQAQHDYLIQLHVSHLEGVADVDSTKAEGGIRVSASWEIVRSRDGALVARGETDRTEPGWKVGDYRSLVNGVENGLRGMAGDLTVCLGRLASAPPASDATLARPMICGSGPPRE